MSTTCRCANARSKSWWVAENDARFSCLSARGFPWLKPHMRVSWKRVILHLSFASMKQTQIQQSCKRCKNCWWFGLRGRPSAGSSCVYSSGPRCAFVFIVLSYTFLSPLEKPSRMRVLEAFVWTSITDAPSCSGCFFFIVIIEQNNGCLRFVKWTVSMFWVWGTSFVISRESDSYSSVIVMINSVNRWQTEQGPLELQGKLADW